MITFIYQNGRVTNRDGQYKVRLLHIDIDIATFRQYHGGQYCIDIVSKSKSDIEASLPHRYQSSSYDCTIALPARKTYQLRMPNLDRQPHKSCISP